MNIIDIIIILLLGLSFVNGFKRGILKEVVMLFGTIIIYIISFLLKGKIGILLCKILPFFKLDGLISLNIFIYQLMAFVLIASFLFTIFSIIMKFTGILQKIVDVSIILTIPSKILGGIIGIFEGYIIIFALLIILSVPFSNNSIFRDSFLNKKIITSSPILSNTLGDLDNIIINVYNIKSSKNNHDKNDLNLKIIDMYLTYNIISKDDLNIIIKTGKLDSIGKIRTYATNN